MKIKITLDYPKYSAWDSLEYRLLDDQPLDDLVDLFRYILINLGYSKDVVDVKIPDCDFCDMCDDCDRPEDDKKDLRDLLKEAVSDA